MIWRGPLGFIVTLGVLGACGGYGSEIEPKPAAPPSIDAGGPDATPSVVTPGTGEARIEAAQIALGVHHGCVRLANGQVWCWGDNSFGQLGRPPSPPDDPVTSAGTAFKVEGIEDAVFIAAGDRTTCAIKRDASLWCWGQNDDGELGYESAQDQVCTSGGARCNHVPTRISSLTVRSVTVGSGNVCAVNTVNVLYCWGRNNFGQTTRPASSTPVPPTPIAISNVSSVRLGHRAYTICALDEDKQVYCWGRNLKGTLGHAVGTSGDEKTGSSFYSTVPAKIAGMDDVIDLVAARSVCAVRAAGEVWCWGANDGNLLALEAPDDDEHPVPQKVAGVSGATRIAAGNAWCALLGTDEVTCWGPSVVASASPPAAPCVTPTESVSPCRAPVVLPEVRLRSLDASFVSAGGVTADGFALTWGLADYGRLGHPSGVDIERPTRVPGLP